MMLPNERMLLVSLQIGASGCVKKKRANAKGVKISLEYVVGRGGTVQGKAVLNIIPSRMYVATWRLWY